MSGATKWANYYTKLSHSNNYYPENFVTRIFLSKSPVQFLDGEYHGKTILDLGCGHGRNIPFLLNNGFDVTGLEVSPEQVSKLKSTFPEQTFAVGLAESLPFSGQSYDFILACNSIYYLSKKSQQFSSHLMEVARVLKPDGFFVFSMLGTQHSIFEGADMGSDFIFTINKDFLGFREGVSIQAYHPDIHQQIFTDFNIIKQGEIVETAEGTCRHLHYFVASKIN